MASAAMFSSLRRSRSPTLEAFLAPVDLENDVGVLLNTLTAVSSDLISSFSGKPLPFQKKNSKSLLRKIELFAVLLDSFQDSTSNLPSTAVLCFKELYLLLYKSKILLHYCSQSSKLWLLLQNHSVSGHFHELNREIFTLLDVLPWTQLDILNNNVKEHLDLLQKQSISAKLFIDKRDDELRLKFFEMLNEIGNGCIPSAQEFHDFFVKKLGIFDAKNCRIELEFLEEQILNHEDDVEPSASVLSGFVAMIRYCRFLLFGFEEDEVEIIMGKRFKKMKKRGLIMKEIADTFITIPKDFCCPISLELMMDPVVISTGQTYDRASISRWIDDGHCSCPKSGLTLVHKKLVPNRALRNLIMRWCIAHRILYTPPESSDLAAESLPAGLESRAAVEANKATARLLIQQLEHGSSVCGKAMAAREIRFLAKTGRENRAFIAEYGAIPYLKGLLFSQSIVAQENAVTAMLNLSIHDTNKRRIMDEEGCLRSIVQVLRFGLTIDCRENAAAILFSLSVVHEYKKKIAEEDGAIETLSVLLSKGTPRGKKDAVTALFNLSTHIEICNQMIEFGAVGALIEALGCDGVAEEAAGALALLVRQPVGAAAVGNEDAAVVGLIGLMRCGTPKGKENAVAALLELCRSGDEHATERVLRAPALAGLLQSLLFTGTKRARRKAASLARVFQQCHKASLHFGGLGVGYAFAGNRDSGFSGETATVPMSVLVS
ncbi:U-box domain-containing protein 17-like [Cynara cardunculus var. scolymus]|uniref:RING-type E3 ubiquitin transferase n=1 Tax=Cynara cardunculus var. scolymus TaxID=59895 RepID=A0A124SDF2_CYNCS|nr:U-box domain-containing protein 17-like [Cynara cardunculus var. scolymus]KVH96790.1 Armadillo [Cynara cardunculus var. scolymus]